MDMITKNEAPLLKWGDVEYWFWTLISLVMLTMGAIGIIYIDYIIGEPIGYKIGIIALFVAVFAELKIVQIRQGI